MVRFSISTFEEICSNFCIDEMLRPLVPDWVTIDEAKVEVMASTLYKVEGESGEPLGFFLYEAVGDSVEVHAFIPPTNRNRSMEILRAFRGYLTDTLGFRRIYTTVSSDFKYIVRVLRMISFNVFNIEDGVVSKNGVLYNLFHMEYIKE